MCTCRGCVYMQSETSLQEYSLCLALSDVTLNSTIYSVVQIASFLACLQLPIRLVSPLWLSV